MAKKELISARNANRVSWELLMGVKEKPTRLPEGLIKEHQEMIHMALSRALVDVKGMNPQIGLLGVIIFGSYAYPDRAHEKSDVNALLFFADDTMDPDPCTQQFLETFNCYVDQISQGGPHMTDLRASSLAYLDHEINAFYSQYYGANLTMVSFENAGLRNYVEQAFDEMGTFAEIRHVEI